MLRARLDGSSTRRSWPVARCPWPRSASERPPARGEMPTDRPLRRSQENDQLRGRMERSVILGTWRGSWNLMVEPRRTFFVDPMTLKSVQVWPRRQGVVSYLTCRMGRRYLPRRDLGPLLRVLPERKTRRMKLTHWYLAALAPIAIAGCSGALLGHMAVLALTIGIFVGTLTLGRQTASTALPSSTSSQVEKA